MATDTEIRMHAIGMAAQMAQGKSPEEIMALAKKVYEFLSGKGEADVARIASFVHGVGGTFHVAANGKITEMSAGPNIVTPAAS